MDCLAEEFESPVLHWLLPRNDPTESSQAGGDRWRRGHEAGLSWRFSCRRVASPRIAERGVVGYNLG